MISLPTPEHLQLLNSRHLADVCADDTCDLPRAEPTHPRSLVGAALVRNARFEQRRRACGVPVRDRYDSDAA